MKEWKFKIFKIIDTHVSFYSRITNLLTPKLKTSFRHLNRGIQDFHTKEVWVPADKAANMLWLLDDFIMLICLIDNNIDGINLYILDVSAHFAHDPKWCVKLQSKILIASDSLHKPLLSKEMHNNL